MNKQMSYRIIDVGGSRCQRNVWAQFFSDATAIIFLAPISAFNERLQEDPSVNKVTDSLQIWDQVTSSPLLQRVSLILFLNSGFYEQVCTHSIERANRLIPLQRLMSCKANCEPGWE